MLNFIIPVRHQDSVEDWQCVKVNIEKTFRSLSRQKGKDWHCYVVANEGCDLPALPEQFTLVSVALPLKKLKINEMPLSKYYDEIRLDKGLRIYEGLKRCSDSSYFMVVDYDDYVHIDISQFVSKSFKSDVVGYKVYEGYLYSSGNLLVKDKNFDEMCGTSNIVKTSFINLYCIDGVLPVDSIKKLLGSHKFLKHEINSHRLVYANLPFPGAIYNVGIAQSTSQAPAVLMRYFTFKKLIKNPFKYFWSIFKIRILTNRIKKQFGMC